jgi:alkanesulfonate monooxygenase SsuD/methylene tetrahydromethanopterin reductase-like flavin-dependent oxidoreductase (luciferase family)
MYFSQLCLVDRRPEQPDQLRLRQQMEEVRLLDQLGYWAVWFAEHHFAGYALCGDSLTICAAAARETSRIRLGAGVVVLPFHHPVRVAEQAALVDCLSDGRLLLGLGRGYQPHEFAGFGQRPDESLARFEQSYATLQRCLTEDDFSYANDFWSGQHVTIWPKPVQRPIPIWAAALSDSSFERYARLGLPILTFPSTIPAEQLQRQIQIYRRAYLQHGHDPANLRIAFTAFTYLEEDGAQADQVFEAAMTRYFGLLDRLTRTEASAEAAHQVYDRIPTTGRLTGNPDQAIARLHWIQDYFGVTDLLNVTHYAGLLSHDQVLSSLRLFAEKVIPAFQGLEVSG